ncbi:MAG TPA: flagellar hook-associated protein 3 [Gammaproteobacteria bacterium]|nr:flagellar hook-associated protein 3 [Gammaproteobacteria bacterium]
MRIGSLQLFNQGIGSILDQQARLFETQNQLSTGKRINRPSDDPTGAAQLVGLSESAKLTKQYQSNILAARARLELEDSALGAVGNALQRVRELTVAALNDTNGAPQRAAIAAEIRQLAGEVMGLANRKDANGQFMFSGFQVLAVPFSETAPGVFSYAGDSGQRQIQVGPARQIADGDSGQAVFMDIADGSGGFESIFTTLETLATDLEANTPNSNSLAQVDRAVEHMLGFRAGAGARLNALDSQRSINEGLLGQLEQTRSTIEDLDYAEAASRLNRQSVGLQAAQQAFIRVQDLNLFKFL